MQPTKQETKYSKSIAGEFFVAAQLQRLGIFASITYGNAKRADVVAFSSSGDKFVIIEVKSTSQQKWKVGSRVPLSSEQPWVFVHLPEKLEEAPSFFILTQAEIHEILNPIEIEYQRRYKEKHGEEYGNRPGFTAITVEQVRAHKDKWNKIMVAL